MYIEGQNFVILEYTSTSVIQLELTISRIKYKRKKKKRKENQSWNATLDLLAPDPFRILLSKGGSLWKL